MAPRKKLNKRDFDRVTKHLSMTPQVLDRVRAVLVDGERQVDVAGAAAARLVSRLDDAIGREIRERSLDSASVGVRRQAELRDASGGDGFVEDHLWTGIGRARSGCGAAIVGDPDQVVAKLERYVELGIDAFILSGYPHLEEAEHFGRLVLPRLDHAPIVVEPGAPNR